jgi:hypothetical protein
VLVYTYIRLKIKPNSVSLYVCKLNQTVLELDF